MVWSIANGLLLVFSLFSVSGVIVDDDELFMSEGEVDKNSDDDVVVVVVDDALESSGNTDNGSGNKFYAINRNSII